MVGVTIVGMRLPEFASNIPLANLRGPSLEDFIVTWEAAERYAGKPGIRGYGETWFLDGVTATCRWLAGGTVPIPGGGFQSVSSPVLGRPVAACPESIEEECDAVEEIGAGKRPVPDGARPGMLAGATFTLLWAWLGEDINPIDAYLERLNELGL